MTTEHVVQYSELRFTLGDRLRKVRRASGDNQRDFAKVLHATQEAVSAWEAGRNYPRDVVAIAQRIERAYGVSAGWVLGITENPRPGRPDGGNEYTARDLNPEPAVWGMPLVRALMRTQKHAEILNRAA